MKSPAIGKVADIAVFDRDFNVKMAVLGGEIVRHADTTVIGGFFVQQADRSAETGRPVDLKEYV